MEPEDLSLHHLVSAARDSCQRPKEEIPERAESPLEAQRITLQIEKELLQAEKAFIVSKTRSIDEGSGGPGDTRPGPSTKLEAPDIADGATGSDVTTNGRPSARERETYSKGTGRPTDALGLVGEIATVATEGSSPLPTAAQPSSPRPPLVISPGTIAIISDAKDSGPNFLTSTEESPVK